MSMGAAHHIQSCDGWHLTEFQCSWTNSYIQMYEQKTTGIYFRLINNQTNQWAVKDRDDSLSPGQASYLQIIIWHHLMWPRVAAAHNSSSVVMELFSKLTPDCDRLRVPGVINANILWSKRSETGAEALYLFKQTHQKYFSFNFSVVFADDICKWCKWGQMIWGSLLPHGF